MTHTTIWITGSNGRLGSVLKEKLKRNPAYKIIGTDQDVDITDPDLVSRFADIHSPDIIINCASVGPKDCEDKVETFKVNTLGARNLAASARKHGAVIIQLSSDDIFEDALGDEFDEFDQPLCHTNYAKSKLAAESYVRELNPKHIILRSSWVYGGKKDTDQMDYFYEVLHHAGKQEPFTASDGYYSTPTSASALADFIKKLIDHPYYGTFHASDQGKCSRYEFARKILKECGYDPELVQKQEEDLHSTKLDNLMMQMSGIYEMPEWQQDLEAFIERRQRKGL